MLNSDEILKRVQSLFKDSEKKVDLSEVITSDDITIYFDGELTESVTAWVSVDGQNVAIPVGEYTLPDGQVLVVEEAGTITKIIAGSPASTVEEITEPVVSEQLSEEKAISLTAENISDIITELLKPVYEKLTELSDVKTENTALKTELNNEAAATEINQSPEGKESKVNGVSFKAIKNMSGVDRVNSLLFGN